MGLLRDAVEAWRARAQAALAAADHEGVEASYPAMVVDLADELLARMDADAGAEDPWTVYAYDVRPSSDPPYIAVAVRLADGSQTWNHFERTGWTQRQRPVIPATAARLDRLVESTPGLREAVAALRSPG